MRTVADVGNAAGATWDDQAHAVAFLLDHLGIDRVAFVALSQGGPSALLLAALHPDRVTSLTCLSCGVAPSASDDQAEANSRGDMLRTVFARDFTYWPIAKFFKRQLMGMLGTSSTVVAQLTPDQRRTMCCCRGCDSRSRGVRNVSILQSHCAPSSAAELCRYARAPAPNILFLGQRLFYIRPRLQSACTGLSIRLTRSTQCA